MREILFRGKRCDNGEWVQGCLVKFGKESFTDDDRYGIMDKTVLVAKTHKNRCAGLVFGYCDYIYHNIRITEIIPKTVGQFTGLTDKNGKKIFDGDIVRVCLDPEICVGNVIWDSEIASYNIPFNNGKCVLPLDIFIAKNKVGEKVWIEVIGNIHDNPELLENP